MQTGVGSMAEINQRFQDDLEDDSIAPEPEMVHEVDDTDMATLLDLPSVTTVSCYFNVKNKRFHWPARVYQR